MTQERIDGETPNGGAYAIAYYQDKDGEPVEKIRAVAVEIVEFNADGEAIWRTYGALEGDI